MPTEAPTWEATTDIPTWQETTDIPTWEGTTEERPTTVSELPPPAQPLPVVPSLPSGVEREMDAYAARVANPFAGVIELPKYETPPMLPGQKPPVLLEVGGGLYNALAGAAESLTSPASAATFGVAGAEQAAGKLAAGIWSAFMAKSVPGQIEEARKAFKEGRPLSQKVEATLAPIVTTALAAAGAREALRPEPMLAAEQISKAQEQARLAGLPSQEPLEVPQAQIEAAQARRMLETGMVAPTTPRQAPVVPETPAQPRLTVVDEIRQANARTIADVQKLFPQAQLTREQARVYRNAAWGAPEQPIVPEVAPEPVRGIVTRRELGLQTPETPPVVAEPRPAPENAPTAPQPSAAAIPEQPVKAAEAVPAGWAEEITTSAQPPKPSEKIQSAAMRAPDGTVYTGRWHPAAYEQYMKDKGVTKEQVINDLQIGKITDGFLTSEGRFVDREEAAQIASIADQFRPDKGGDIAFAGGLKGIESGPGKISTPKTVEAIPTPSTEPAISFPGIGSLREQVLFADTTPLRESEATPEGFRKMQRSEPERYKAVASRLSTQRGTQLGPTALARMAKQRFEQMKAAPAQNEPPLGSTMLAGFPDPIATTRAVTKLFNQVRQNETVDRITRQVAGESAPHTMAASEPSGEALIRFASAKGTGRLMGRAKATEVLGDKAKDEAFRKKLGAVIVQDQLLATKKKFQDMADKAIDPKEKSDLQDMADKAGAAGSPFKTDAEFQAALADPDIQAALARHRDIVQPIAEQAHEMLGGRMMEAGEATGTFANLIAILGEEKAGEVFGGGRGELTRPRKRPSKFFFERKGTAAAYETDYQKIASRMVEGNFDEVAKRELYDQLEADGLAVAARPGIPAPEIGSKKSVKFEIQRRGTPGGMTQTENLWVREDIARELRQALDVDGPVARAGWVRAASIANAIQLAGPTDAVFHVANMLSSITRSQGGRNALVDLARKLPGVNIADTITRIAVSAKRVIQDSAEIQNRIAELSDIGAMRPLMEIPKPEGLQKLNPFAQKFGGRLIQLLDISGRLVREDLFNNLVKRGLVEDTPANRREWINQLGQYNPRLMGQFQRMMRDFGVSPFVVAGRNFNRNAIRSLLLSQGVKASSPRAWAVMKAVDVAGFAMTVFGVSALLNYWLTGNPNGSLGTKIGEIDTGKGNIKIDPLQWTGMRRGMRITGIDALVNGQRWNSSTADTRYAAGRDVVNGLLHPWMGPVPKAGAIATTGYGSIGFKESPNPKDWGQNLLAAAEQLNPVVKSVVKGWEQKSETAEAGVPEKAGAAIASTAKSLAGALGVKERREKTARQQITGIHDDWLAAHPRKEVREDYQRSLTEQLPTPKYMAVYAALRDKDPEALKKAVNDLKASGVKLSEIKNQIRPVTVGTETEAGHQKNLFHQSSKLEREFRRSLSPEQRKLYNDALAERQTQWRFFRRYF